MIQTIVLDTYRSFFRDGASYDQFIGVLRSATHDGHHPAIIEESAGDVLCAAVPFTETELAKAVVQQLGEHPETLRTLLAAHR